MSLIFYKGLFYKPLFNRKNKSCNQKILTDINSLNIDNIQQSSRNSKNKPHQKENYTKKRSSNTLNNIDPLMDVSFATQDNEFNSEVCISETAPKNFPSPFLELSPAINKTAFKTANFMDNTVKIPNEHDFGMGVVVDKNFEIPNEIDIEKTVVADSEIPFTHQLSHFNQDQNNVSNYNSLSHEDMHTNHETLEDAAILADALLAITNTKRRLQCYNRLKSIIYEFKKK